MSGSLKTRKEGEIQEVTELAWFKTLPTVWDETKVLEGNMENYITMARRSENDWFIGSLNGITPREVKWSCDFLDKKKKYKAVIYTDDSTMNTATGVKRTIMMIDYRSTLSFYVGGRNGMAIHICPL